MAWLGEGGRASPAIAAAPPLGPPRSRAELLPRMRRILGMAEILCPIPGIPRPRCTNTTSVSTFPPLSGRGTGGGLVERVR